MAVLVYTSPPRASWLRGKIDFAERVDMNTDAVALRHLEVWVNDRYHKVLIADTPDVMRGLDYRGRHKGICLILDRGFSNHREGEQALARVGRQNEKSERYLSAHVNLVDLQLSQALITKLISYEQALGAEKTKNKAGAFAKPLVKKKD